MSAIKIANAPCSWGTLEFEGMSGKRITCEQMLDELRETGYSGTELGDWGFMPTEPRSLEAEMSQRGLKMVGAFVPVQLRREEAHAAGEAEALKIARLLADVHAGQRPFIVLADANGTDPVRTRNAGRVTPEMGLSDPGMGDFRPWSGTDCPRSSQGDGTSHGFSSPLWRFGRDSGGDCAADGAYGP